MNKGGVVQLKNVAWCPHVVGCTLFCISLDLQLVNKSLFVNFENVSNTVNGLCTGILWVKFIASAKTAGRG